MDLGGTLPLIKKRKMYRKRKIYIMAINSALGYGYWAYNFSIFNSLQEYLADYIFPNASTTTVSLIQSFINIGSIIGALIAGSLVSRLGRRKSMLLADVFGIIAVGLMLIKSLPVLLIGRLLSGIVSGLNIVAIFMYQVEVSPLPMCGATGTLSVIISETFSFVSLAMGFAVPSQITGRFDEEIWRVLVAVSAILNVLRLIGLGFIWRFETPFFLIEKGKKEQAKKVLGKIFDNGIEDEYKRIATDVEMSTNEGSIGFWDLFGPKYRKILFIGFLLAVIQHFGGMSIIFIFSNDIFGRSTDNDVLFSTILGVINLLSVFLALFLVEKFGRRALLLTGLFAITIIWLAFGLIATISGEDNPSLKYLLLVWPIFFQISLGSLTFLYISETLPSIGSSFCVAANWTSASLISIFYLQVVGAVGLGPFFLFCALLCFLCWLAFCKYLVETKGKTRTEIIELFAGSGGKVLKKKSDSYNLQGSMIEAGKKISDIETENVKEGEIIPLKESKDSEEGIQTVSEDTQKVKRE